MVDSLNHIDEILNISVTTIGITQRKHITFFFTQEHPTVRIPTPWKPSKATPYSLT